MEPESNVPDKEQTGASNTNVETLRAQFGDDVVAIDDGLEFAKRMSENSEEGK